MQLSMKENRWKSPFMLLFRSRNLRAKRDRIPVLVTAIVKVQNTLCRALLSRQNCYKIADLKELLRILCLSKISHDPSIF